MNTSAVTAVEMLSLAREIVSDDWTAPKEMKQLKEIAVRLGMVSVKSERKRWNKEDLIEAMKAKAQKIIDEAEEAEEVIEEEAIEEVEEEVIEEANDDTESVSSIESAESELPTAMEVTPAPMDAIEHIEVDTNAILLEKFNGADKEAAELFLAFSKKSIEEQCNQFVTMMQSVKIAEAMMRDIKLREAENKLREAKKEINRLKSIPSASPVPMPVVSAEKPKLNAYQEFQKNPKLNELIKKHKPSLTQNEIVSEKARLWGLKKKNPALTEEELINM